MDEAELEKYFERFLFVNCWTKKMRKTPPMHNWKVGIREFQWNTKIMVQKLRQKWDENNRKTSFTPRPFLMQQNKLWKSTTHWWRDKGTSLLAPYLEFYLLFFFSNPNNNTFTDCLITHCITNYSQNYCFSCFVNGEKEENVEKETISRVDWNACLTSNFVMKPIAKKNRKPSKRVHWTMPGRSRTPVS